MAATGTASASGNGGTGATVINYRRKLFTTQAAAAAVQTVQLLVDLAGQAEVAMGRYSNNCALSTAGAVNTGGGAGYFNNGGSGIVIIRYITPS